MADSSRRSLYITATTTFGSLIALAAFIIHWYSRFEPERQQLTERINAVKQQINRGTIARAREKEFESEVARLEAQIKNLDLHLPVSLDLEPFMDAFQAAMNAMDIEVHSYDYEIRKIEDLYLQCSIRVHLSAPIKDVSILKFDRLVKWHIQQEDWSSPAFDIFAFPQLVKKEDSIDPCSERAEVTVFWPLSKDITRLRGELKRLCAERAGMLEEIGKVEQLDVLRMRLMRKQAVIDQIILPKEEWEAKKRRLMRGLQDLRKKNQ
ncbi:hypothetical protein L0222_02250 [bacterium]|nr:hypothetical protein [bacterium]MCI0602824.1 hypothetical protein [bacterium]